jgi:uncharacterized phage-associated protein
MKYGESREKRTHLRTCGQAGLHTKDARGEPRHVGGEGCQRAAVLMRGLYSPLAVANEFIRRAGNVGVDHMKLQKLVYYAHGLSLSRGETLVNEQPQVWKLGPVFNSLYFELKYHGGDLITVPERESTYGRAPAIDRSDSESSEYVDRVWGKFAKYTAMQLSNRTHKPGTPWFITAQRHGWRVPRDAEIERATMADYFSKYGLDG